MSLSELIIRVNISREMGWLEDIEVKDYSIVISSHILEGLKKRFTSMLLKTKLPYIIDPYTYIFTSDLQEVKDKRWYPNLVALYGLDLIMDPDAGALSSDLLIDRNNQPTENLNELVENVINYQRTRIQDVYDEIFEFEEFEGKQDSISTISPKCIIPPYFFLGAGSVDWLTVNIRCIQYALQNRQENEKIFAVIMLDKDLLSFKDDVKQIIQEYSLAGIDGYFVWPAYFDENSPKRTEIRLFSEFIDELSKFQKPIYNMYGGLFSLLLHDRGITGISHAICYGEHKAPFASSGMAATIRYYEPSIHSKIPFGRMDEIQDALKLEKCNCKYCSEIYNTNDKGKQLELSGKHFIFKRIQELNNLRNNGASAFLAEIIQDAKRAEENDQVGAYSNFYEKFAIWKEAL